jgi:glutathione S-transferase
LILNWLDRSFGARTARQDPFERAVEEMLIALEGPFTAQGCRPVLDQDTAPGRATPSWG